VRGFIRGSPLLRERDGPLMFPAVNDLLKDKTLDFLGPRGSRLVYLTEIRSVDEGWVVEEDSRIQETIHQDSVENNVFKEVIAGESACMSSTCAVAETL
jgi:hypothetical protein